MKIKATNVKLIIEIEKKSTLKTYKLSNAGFDTNSCCFGLMWNTVEENFASLLLPRDLNIHEKKNTSCLRTTCKLSSLKPVLNR